MKKDKRGHKASKASILSHRAERGMPQANQHHGCNHKANGPKDQQAQAHEGYKAWQEHKSSQININTKHRSKQAYTCIKEMIQTL